MCNITCRPISCGDGFTDSPETCDETSATCTRCSTDPLIRCDKPFPNKCVVACFDNISQPNEVCEGTGCNHSCTGPLPGWKCDPTTRICTEVCGDGVLVGSESCDDGSNDAKGCNSTCNGNSPDWICSSKTITPPASEC